MRHAPECAIEAEKGSGGFRSRIVGRGYRVKEGAIPVPEALALELGIEDAFLEGKGEVKVALPVGEVPRPSAGDFGITVGRREGFGFGVDEVNRR